MRVALRVEAERVDRWKEAAKAERRSLNSWAGVELDRAAAAALKEGNESPDEPVRSALPSPSGLPW